MISVLFTQKNSSYDALGCDTYDLSRDALSCSNKSAAIYHPPCRSWGRLRKQSNWHPGEHWLSVWSVIRCRRFGGIVEHPVDSLLWRFMNIPAPGEVDEFGGIFLIIDQVNFGFPCRKRTGLYIVGLSATSRLRASHPFAVPTHVIESSAVNPSLPSLAKARRAETSLTLAAALVDLCMSLIV